MISGQQTLASIDAALNEARAKVAAIEAQIAEANVKLTELQQAQTRDYRALAKLRVDLVSDGALIQHLDQAEAQVARLLEQRRAALADLERQIQTAERTGAPLEHERAARAAEVDTAAARVDEARAKTQARLDADPVYEAQRARAQEAERTAMHAAEKARLRSDDLPVPARAPVPLTGDLRLSGAAATARDALTAWDFVLDKDSVAAGVYAMFQRRLLAVQRPRPGLLSATGAACARQI